MTRDKSCTPSSSPAPIHESQPRPNSPTKTAHGTTPYHALYDTPPKGTQPPELKCSDQVRMMSAHGRRTFEYQLQQMPTASRSNATASQPHATTTTQPRTTAATQPTGSQRCKGPAEHWTLCFDSESSGDELGAKLGAKLRIPKSRKPCNTTGSQTPSPPPKPLGQGRAPAQGDRAPEQRVVLEAEIAREFGDLIGINISTATSTTIKEALRTLSNPNPIQVGLAQWYSQVRGQSPQPLPSLNKKGGYYHETLLKLAHTQPSESQKRTRSDEEDRPAKRARDDIHGKTHGEDCGESADEEMWDPDADKPEPSAPAPPHLPSLFLPPKNLSMSSTQCAVVNAFASQRHVAETPDFRPTPVPQPKNLLSWFTPKPRTSNSESRAPNPKPRPMSHEPLHPDPGSRSATPELRPSSPPPCVLTSEPRHAKATHPSRPPVPLASSHKPAPGPDPNSATKEETESEPQLKPKPKWRRRHLKKTSQGRHVSPKPGTKPSDHRQHSAGERNMRDALSDAYSVLQHLNDLFSNNPDPEANEVESLLQHADDLTQQCHAGHHSSLRTQPGPSSLRTQLGRLSLHAQAVSSPSRARQAPASSHRNRQWPTHEGRPLDHSSEGEASASETDVEDTDADNPVVPGKSGLGRYPGTQGKVASCAIPKLLSTATHKGIYQDHDTCIKWACNTYCRTWKTFCPHIQYRECPLNLLQTMVSRISNLQTEVKKRIQQLICYLFRFVLGLSEEVLLANWQLVAWLSHNNFHCRNGLPLPAVAFVLTMMQGCIKEWQTRQFKPRELNLTTQQSIFDAHLMGLLEYCWRALRRLSDFQRRWFEDGMVNAGVEIHQHEEGERFCQSITQAENVQPDTPEEPGDSEPEYDGNGQLTAWSKGKFRVQE